MTELTHYRPPDQASNGVAHIGGDHPGANLIAWADSLSAAHRIATALCETSFVPRHFAGKPFEAAAALMLGDELGFAPVSALRSIFVIGGTPGLYAKSIVALVQSAGHEVWTEHDTADKVVVCAQRRGSNHIEKSEWTTARARKAGYTNNRKYDTDPQAMLYARAAADVCRKIAADVLAGIPYAVEELELEQPTPTKRVTRAKPEPPPMPEPPLETAEEPVTATDANPDAVTSGQLKKMGALMREAGMTDRDLALEYVSETVDRLITTRNDLTRSEAGRVIDRLELGDMPAEPSFDDMDTP